jgi:hypothetical protein
MSAESLSVLLLLRDEVRDAEELLPTLGFAREVVVVWDPRGDRAAREAAARLGARVFERVFDGFGAQRQFALEQCREPWVLWIDADERLEPSAIRAIAAITGGAPSGPASEAAWAFTLRRTSFFLGKRIRFCGWGGERVLRLFRRRSSRFDGALVHEQVRFAAAAREPASPAVRSLEAGLLHDSYRTVADCEAKLERYAQANAEKSFRSGRRAGALDVLLRPPLRFLRQYVLQLGFLDGEGGLKLCVYAARQVRRKYQLLRERTRTVRAE